MEKLKRTTFEVSREMEFFTEKELQMQIGYGKAWWPVAILKELVDNALDACEMAAIAPEIGVEVKGDSFSVRDNGPGLPKRTLRRSLDYLKRVSDKAFYVSPTRGQIGNALKVVWAAPFVADGETGKVEVWTKGTHETINVSLDHIAQRPTIEGTRQPCVVENGTLIRVHWPNLSRLLLSPEEDDSYKVPVTAKALMESYAAFNPHARFRVTMPGEKLVFEPTKPTWRKWRPDAPTPAHWYTAETLADLIAAYIAREKDGGEARTVRKFVSEFRGLSSTAKQKRVTGDLAGVHLHDLVAGGKVNKAIVEKLLGAMMENSRPPKAAALGLIGEEHLKTWMVRYADVTEESAQYVKRPGGTDKMPHIIEVGFGVRKEDEIGRRVLTGLNWSPTLGVPVAELDSLIQEARLDPHDPVTMVVNLAKPRFEFTDRGKTRLQL